MALDIKKVVIISGAFYSWNLRSKESNAIGCHIRNLREKLFQASPNTPFNIKCVREVGYYLETEKE